MKIKESALSALDLVIGFIHVTYYYLIVDMYITLFVCLLGLTAVATAAWINDGPTMRDCVEEQRDLCVDSEYLECKARLCVECGYAC